MAEERIGDFLVRIGALTSEQVDEILKQQKKEPDKIFGVIAIELGYINDDALRAYVEEKRK
ncbi:MAG: hypothetical protein JW881_08215 [Spirochaetales bacterium]|nr:hypothetical protein [Spirochaetales bacterium]